MIFYIFLAVLLYLTPTLSRDISNEEKERGSRAFFTTHYNECGHLISEETYEMLLDGIVTEDDEVFRYSECIFQARKWMVNSKINGEQIATDIPIMIERELTLIEQSAILMICNYCGKEAEMYETDRTVMTGFSKCAFDRIQNDM